MPSSLRIDGPLRQVSVLTDLLVRLRFGDRPSQCAAEINKVAGNEINNILHDSKLNEQQQLQHIIKLARRHQVSWNVVHTKCMDASNTSASPATKRRLNNKTAVSTEAPAPFSSNRGEDGGCDIGATQCQLVGTYHYNAGNG